MTTSPDERPKRLYLVTIKVPKDVNHNPRAKVTGPCPATGAACTDTTGEHHTVAVWTNASLEYVAAESRRRYGHVTRVEAIFNTIVITDPQDDEEECGGAR